MNSLAIIFLVISIIEGIFIVWLFRKNKKKQSNDKISVHSLRVAFEKFDCNIDNVSESNIEDNLRMFKLQTQNDEYERAEYRVFGKFESFLNELWRLKREDNDITAKNLLVLLENKLHISYNDQNNVIFDENAEKKYEIISPKNNRELLEIIKPIWYLKENIIIKGIAK